MGIRAAGRGGLCAVLGGILETGCGLPAPTVSVPLISQLIVVVAIGKGWAYWTMVNIGSALVRLRSNGTAREGGGRLV